MLDRILIGSSAEPTDPNFKNVTLLLHGDGSNGAQNNTFIDSSTNNFTITRNGNTTQGSFSPYGSNWSNYFDGSGDYLTSPSSSALGFGTGDFTVEAWVYTPAFSAIQAIIDLRSSAVAEPLALSISSTGLARSYDLTVRTGGQLNANQWNHIAWVRASGVNTVYVNGAVGHTWTNSGDYGSSRPAWIGMSAGGGSEPFTGYISNLRVVKGTAVYTSNFTPSTTPLTAITNTSLLTCQSNRFRDASTNNFTITTNGDVKVTNFAPFAPSSSYSTSANGGSVYGDGSGDGLTVSTNAAFAFGTGDFTIEFWGYYPGWAGDAQLVGAHTAFVGFDFLIQQYGSGAFRWLDSSLTLSSGFVPSTSSWHHFAVTRSGTTLRIFVDGDLKASGTSTANISSTYKIGILCDSGGSASQVGYMNDVRIVKGTAVYTASFTPPTTPLGAISGTSLLLRGTNAAIFDNSMKNDLETVGNAQISTSVKKFGTGSMAFDGTDDRLFIPTTPQFGFGTGDYTVEFWLYMSALPGTKYTLFDFRTASTAETHTIYVNSSGYMGFYNGSADVTSSSQPLSINTWYHVAYSRGSGTLKIFVAGTQAYSAANTIDYQATRPLTIGAGVSGIEVLNGYIDDLRITKGVARYTANFTPPTAAFPNK